MKTSKIDKHLEKRTVVFGQAEDRPTTIGVITCNDLTDVPILISGVRMDLEGPDRDCNWCRAENVRKATAEEIEIFFAWLRSDRRDIDDGFGRFGGQPPRGFVVEAPAGAAAPTEEKPGRVYTNADSAEGLNALLGAMVEIVDACPSTHNGEVGRVLIVDTEGGAPVRVEVVENGTKYGWWADKIRLVAAADPGAPKRLTVGDKVVAVGARREGLACIGTINRDDADGVPYKIDSVTDRMFMGDEVFPRTVEGFRAAHALQKEKGVVPEEGDFVAVIDDEDGAAPNEVLSGVLGGGGIRRATRPSVPIVGVADWSDRVVVLCKGPKL